MAKANDALLMEEPQQAKVTLTTATSTEPTTEHKPKQPQTLLKLIKAIIFHKRFDDADDEEEYVEFYFANQKKMCMVFLCNNLIFQAIILWDLIYGRLRSDAFNTVAWSLAAAVVLALTLVFVVVNFVLLIVLYLILFRSTSKAQAGKKPPSSSSNNKKRGKSKRADGNSSSGGASNKLPPPPTERRTTRRLSGIIMLLSFALATVQLWAYILIHPAEKAGGGIAFHPILIFIFLQLPFSQTIGNIITLLSSFILAAISTLKPLWVEQQLQQPPDYSPTSTADYESNDFEDFDLFADSPQTTTFSSASSSLSSLDNAVQSISPSFSSSSISVSEVSPSVYPTFHHSKSPFPPPTTPSPPLLHGHTKMRFVARSNCVYVFFFFFS